VLHYDNEENKSEKVVEIVHGLSHNILKPHLLTTNSNKSCYTFQLENNTRQVKQILHFSAIFVEKFIPES
jgi:hypothetical protein